MFRRESLTVFLDEHSAEDGAAELSEAVMNPLQDALRRRPQLGVSVVRDEGAAGGPDGGVGDTCTDDVQNDPTVDVLHCAYAYTYIMFMWCSDPNLNCTVNLFSLNSNTRLARTQRARPPKAK